MLNKSLFEVITDYHLIIDELVEYGGEITPEIEEALKINAEELESKIVNYHRIIKMLEANKTVITDELERLKGKTKTIDNMIDRLKNNVKIAVETFGEKTESGGSRLKYPLVNCWTVNTKPVVLEETYDAEDITYPEVAYRDISIRIPVENKQKFADFFVLNNTPFKEEVYLDNKKAKEILLMNSKIEGLKIDYNASYVRMK